MAYKRHNEARELMGFLAPHYHASMSQGKGASLTMIGATWLEQGFCQTFTKLRSKRPPKQLLATNMSHALASILGTYRKGYATPEAIKAVWKARGKRTGEVYETSVKLALRAIEDYKKSRHSQPDLGLEEPKKGFPEGVDVIDLIDEASLLLEDELQTVQDCLAEAVVTAMEKLTPSITQPYRGRIEKMTASLNTLQAELVTSAKEKATLEEALSQSASRISILRDKIQNQGVELDKFQRRKPLRKKVRNLFGGSKGNAEKRTTHQ